MNLETCFPETIFVDEYVKKYGITGGIVKQLKVITNEVIEVQKPVIRNNFDRAMEELLDTMHATHTALRMIPGYNVEKVSDVIKQIQDKNYKRGYYKVQNNG